MKKLLLALATLSIVTSLLSMKSEDLNPKLILDIVAKAIIKNTPISYEQREDQLNSSYIVGGGLLIEIPEQLLKFSSIRKFSATYFPNKKEIVIIYSDGKSYNILACTERECCKQEGNYCTSYMNLIKTIKENYVGPSPSKQKME